MSSERVHELKSWAKFFVPMWLGQKLFDIRVNDRDYQLGDHLILKEYYPDEQKYTGRVIEARVIYITDAPENDFGYGYFLRTDVVVMGVSILAQRVQTARAHG